MTVHDNPGHLQDLYGVQVSPDLIGEATIPIWDRCRLDCSGVGSVVQTRSLTKKSRRKIAA